MTALAKSQQVMDFNVVFLHAGWRLDWYWSSLIYWMISFVKFVGIMLKCPFFLAFSLERLVV